VVLVYAGKFPDPTGLCELCSQLPVLLPIGWVLYPLEVILAERLLGKEGFSHPDCRRDMTSPACGTVKVISITRAPLR